MPLSWNEIRNRAYKFEKEWADETDERAEAKSFWDAFFEVFGISRREIEPGLPALLIVVRRSRK